MRTIFSSREQSTGFSNEQHLAFFNSTSALKCSNRGLFMGPLQLMACIHCDNSV